MQFSFFIDNYWWPFSVDDGTRKPSSVDFYRNIYKRIGEYFGDWEIENIKPLDIEIFLRNIRMETNLSQCSIRHIYSTLKNIMLAARKYEVINRNPMEFVKKPPQDPEPIKAVTRSKADEFFAYIANIKGLYKKTVMMTLVTTGLRRGELCALKWSDVDFNAMTITVQRNVTYSRENGISVGTPKTKSSFRTVILVPATAELLWQLREKNREYMKDPDAPDDDCYIFHSHESNHHDVTRPATPSAVTRMVTAEMKKAGFENMSAHSLRHTCATLLLSNGSNIKVVQSVLGHADAAVTLNFYATVDIKDLYGAAQAFSATYLERQNDEENLPLLPSGLLNPIGNTRGRNLAKIC